MSVAFHNNHKHPSSFYQSILAVLIACRASSLTYTQTATALNTASLVTPTGSDWTESHVKQMLKGLRNSERYPSRIHAALMSLVFNETFSIAQAHSILKLSRP